MLQIGSYRLDNRVLLAPMAGVADLPFRRLCRALGAGLAVSEMVSAKPELRGHRRTLLKMAHGDEPEPRTVQIAGADPDQMADAARWNVDAGAQIIDINLGCPAKKVCNRAAGSALLRDQPLVARILHAVVRAVPVPVTLKMRTGWDPQRRNAVQVAQMAEDLGIQAVAIHGRTRACGFSGSAEYRTIAAVKQAVAIPVIANGDIATAEQADAVLRLTGADAVMIGRAARGQPWLLGQIARRLEGSPVEPFSRAAVATVVAEHLDQLYAFYGEAAGVRIARKHIAWYTRVCGVQTDSDERAALNRIDDAHLQQTLVRRWWHRWLDTGSE